MYKVASSSLFVVSCCLSLVITAELTTAYYRLTTDHFIKLV